MAKTGYTILIIAIVAILAIGAVVLLMNNNPMSANAQSVSDTGSQPSSPSVTGQVTSNPMPQVSSPQTYMVNIQNYAFSPVTLVIKPGDTVVWTNMDNVVHTVTSDTGNELNSPNLEKGQSYSHTFDAVGTYTYYCAIHPMMKATIIVQTSDSSTTTTSANSMTNSTVSPISGSNSGY